VPDVADATIRLRLPAQQDFVSLARATVRVVAGRVGCSDDARTRLQAATGLAYFVLLDALAGEPATVTLTMTWDTARVTASLGSTPPPRDGALASLETLGDLADGHELVDHEHVVRLWIDL
jgi:hypothetical protein